MSYTDTLFLAAFVGVCLLSHLLRPWPALKEWFLIGVSLFVIASWGFFDLALFLAVLFINFCAVFWMMRSEDERSRLILTSTIVLDVLILTIFKYTNFLGSSLGSVTGLKIPTFPLGIPLAISFYTFHLISYLVDVHARRVKVATIREYVFYLSFFPHVIAGPIVRAWQLVPQIGKQRRVRTDMAMGMHYLITGFFLKMVVANNIGAMNDRLWAGDTTWALSSADYWIVAFLYYCQIYGDFAGYSLMALGMARLLGYRLPANFRSPMRAASIQEFWKRWHITLSRWLRDYLYIPLGGNRVSAFRAGQNALITMLLGGLWHGAGWGFVIWGGMHGTGIIIERYLGFTARNLGRSKVVFWWVMTQMWVTVAWVFFRSPSLTSATSFLHHMLPSPHNLIPHMKVVALLVLALPVIAHNCFPIFMTRIGRRNLGLVLGISSGVMLVLNIIIFSPTAVFIYFRF